MTTRVGAVVLRCGHIRHLVKMLNVLRTILPYYPWYNCLVGTYHRVDGAWSAWGQYTSCDKSCGGGIHVRFRFCTNPPPSDGGFTCVGNSLETASCNKQNCPSKWIFTNSFILMSLLSNQRPGLDIELILYMYLILCIIHYRHFHKSKYSDLVSQHNPLTKRDIKTDWLVGFYTVSAAFQTYNGGHLYWRMISFESLK